ncbi:hypothetical protein OH717_05835 [Streptomyces albidoflavus]|nr:hypothetical protein OH717_05835 [Streptomyces albidoflavus]
MTTTGRCAAAHQDDPTPCDRPPDAVSVLDSAEAGVHGCEHHGARLLASLEGGRAVEGSSPAAGARVAMAADSIRPFCWYEDAPRTRPEQLSHDENRTLASGIAGWPIPRETF